MGRPSGTYCMSQAHLLIAVFYEAVTGTVFKVVDELLPKRSMTKHGLAHAKVYYAIYNVETSNLYTPLLVRYPPACSNMRLYFLQKQNSLNRPVFYDRAYLRNLDLTNFSS